MNKIIKSFGRLPASEIKGGGVKSQTSWEALLPVLRHHFHIKPNESLEGIEVTEKGIRAHIKTK